MRLFLLLLPSILLANGCPVLTNSTYRNSAHLSAMNLSILYEEEFSEKAQSVECYLKDVFQYTHLVPISSGESFEELCNNSHFQKLTRFGGLIRVTVTLSRINSTDIEKNCNVSANLLHLKMAEGRWLAHMLTARSDFITEIGQEKNMSRLWKAIEMMLVLAGPVLSFPKRGVYKAMYEQQVKEEENAWSWIRWLVGAGVSSLLVIATALAVVAGRMAHKRQKNKRKEAAMLLSEKAINDGNESDKGGELCDEEWIDNGEKLNEDILQ